MKKVLVLLLLALSLSGCEKDDDSSITGTWKVHSNFTGVTENTSLDECDLDTKYVFDGNQDFWRSGPQVTSSGYICVYYAANKWKKISGGYQIVNSANNTVAADIIKVSRDTLRFQNIQGYTSDYKKILVRQ